MNSGKYPYTAFIDSIQKDGVKQYLQNLAVRLNSTHGNDWNGGDVVDLLTHDMETLGVDINQGVAEYYSERNGIVEIDDEPDDRYAKQHPGIPDGRPERSDDDLPLDSDDAS
jgi:hypothetical protein